MPNLPLIKRLKKQAHRNLALAQDIMLAEIYNRFPTAIVHGGTAIWRVFGSNRFSEDIDVYLPKNFRKSESVKEFLENLKKAGFEAKKFREKENSIFSVFAYRNSVVRFEAVFADIKNFTTKPFELADGNFINVHTLSSEDFVLEKISAYGSRKKVRDLYDIFFLLKFIEKREKVLPALKNFAKSFSAPADSADMKTLIISGAVPSVKDMMEEIKRWAK